MLMHKDTPSLGEFLSYVSGDVPLSAEEVVEGKCIRNLVEKHLADLPPRTQRVLKGYYGIYGCEELTLAEIAQLEGLSTVYVGQIKNNALRKLGKLEPLREACAALTPSPLTNAL